MGNRAKPSPLFLLTRGHPATLAPDDGNEPSFTIAHCLIPNPCAAQAAPDLAEPRQFSLPPHSYQEFLITMRGGHGAFRSKVTINRRIYRQ